MCFHYDVQVESGSFVCCRTANKHAMSQVPGQNASAWLKSLFQLRVEWPLVIQEFTRASHSQLHKPLPSLPFWKPINSEEIRIKCPINLANVSQSCPENLVLDAWKKCVVTVTVWSLPSFCFQIHTRTKMDHFFYIMFAFVHRFASQPQIICLLMS